MKMSCEFVEYLVEEGIAIITINHPPANALDKKTTCELGQVFDELASEKRVKGVILTGAGEKIFVAGADITMTRNKAKSFLRNSRTFLIRLKILRRL
jgi:enoyl-CoA hydratase/carnithine racemase